MCYNIQNVIVNFKIFLFFDTPLYFRGFQSFNEDYLQLPTYAALTALFDNYEPLVGDPEPECSVCRAEEDLLMAAMFEDSPIMTELWSFLQGFGEDYCKNATDLSDLKSVQQLGGHKSTYM